MNKNDDDIFPDRFPMLEGRYFYYPGGQHNECGCGKALSGCPDFTVIVADSQKSGRGRHGRKWVSEKGGIYCSIVLRPDVTPESCFRINFMVSAVLARLLREGFGIEAFCKWPNDIIAGGGKLAGMIAESMIEDGKGRVPCCRAWNKCQ